MTRNLLVRLDLRLARGRRLHRERSCFGRRCFGRRHLDGLGGLLLKLLLGGLGHTLELSDQRAERLGVLLRHDSVGNRDDERLCAPADFLGQAVDVSVERRERQTADPVTKLDSELGCEADDQTGRGELEKPDAWGGGRCGDTFHGFICYLVS